MKIRNRKKITWIFFPAKGSPLKYKLFKNKAPLMKYLNGHLMDALNGVVRLHEDGFGYSYTGREWDIWCNINEHRRGSKLKIDLRTSLFRGSKYIFKHKVPKEDKRWFAFSDKVYNLMYDISTYGLTPNKAKNLVDIFYKRGFVDFVPDAETQEYINKAIEEGIPFDYWSDRCNGVRCKAIIEYFKKEKLI